MFSSSALTLLLEHQERHPTEKNTLRQHPMAFPQTSKDLPF